MSGEPRPELLVFAPDPDDPDWLVIDGAGTGRFVELFGRVRMRAEGERVARCRFTPGPQHRNLMDGVHGGYLMAIVDQVLFLGPRTTGHLADAGGVTLSTATEFFAPVTVDRPIDAVVEVLRATGRLIFMRGLIEQDGVAAVSFSGTIRKPAP